MTTRALLTLGLTSVVGCFTPPNPPVLFACEPDGAAACPEGYACQADGCCHRIGSDYEQHQGECRLGAGDGPPATTTPGGSTETGNGTSDSTTDAESTGSTTGDAESTGTTTTDAESTDTTDAERTSTTTDAESTSDTGSTQGTETGDSDSTSTATDTT